MKRLVTTLTVLSAFVAVNAQASTADIDALVEKVRQEALLEASHDQERIERFLAEQDSQAQLLEDAQRRLAAENARADRLRNEYEANELTLTQYEADLEERIILQNTVAWHIAFACAALAPGSNTANSSPP